MNFQKIRSWSGLERWLRQNAMPPNKTFMLDLAGKVAQLRKAAKASAPAKKG